MPVSDQGPLSARYSIIPRTLIFLTSSDQVLLIKGAPQKKLWANLYNGIGGHVERGEDVLSAAYRELDEEAGLAPEQLRLVGVVLIDTGQASGIGLYILKGECKSKQFTPSDEGSLEWVQRSQLLSLPLVEDLPTLLPRVLDHQAGEAPFSAIYRYAPDGQLEIAFSTGR